MWMHGGAFILCNTATHAQLLSSVGVGADARVLSVEYPLGPDQANYGDMLGQVLAAYRWLVDPAGGGAAPEDVVVGGDSAGGHLALGLVLAIKRERETEREAREQQEEEEQEERTQEGGERAVGSSSVRRRLRRGQQPAGVVLMSPWLDPGRDHPGTSASWNNAVNSADYLRGVEHTLGFISDVVFGSPGGNGGGGGGEETPLGSEPKSEVESASEHNPPRNLLQTKLWEGAAAHSSSSSAAAGLAGVGSLPPMLVQFGGAEVLAGEARVFGEMAAGAGLDVTLEEWDDMPHVFQVFASVAPEGVAAIKSAAAFVNRVTSVTSPRS
jgi:acetyl esterase/lipase